MTKTRGHINPFFVEIIIILLFFSIAAAVTLNLFARSRLCSIESAQLTTSVAAAQTAVELTISQAASGGLTEGMTEIYFDAGGEVVPDGGECAYVARLYAGKAEIGVAHCTVTVTAAEGTETIYTLEFDVALPEL